MKDTQSRNRDEPTPDPDQESDAAVFERLAERYADREEGRLFEYLARAFKREG